MRCWVLPTMLTENEILEKRSVIEARIMQWFESFTFTINLIVQETLQLYLDNRITQQQAYELMYFQMMETYATNDAVVNKQLELYLRDAYLIGLESIDEDTEISVQDVAVLFLLFKAAKTYVLGAEKVFLAKALDAVAKIDAKFLTSDQMLHRFEMIIVTEGTRSVVTSIIVRTTPKGVLLEYQTELDALVCSICSPFHGNTYYPYQVWGLIPQHPFCRCWFTFIDPMEIVEEIE